MIWRRHRSEQIYAYGRAWERVAHLWADGGRGLGILEDDLHISMLARVTRSNIRRVPGRAFWKETLIHRAIVSLPYWSTIMSCRNRRPLLLQWLSLLTFNDCRPVLCDSHVMHSGCGCFQPIAQKDPFMNARPRGGDCVVDLPI